MPKRVTVTEATREQVKTMAGFGFNQEMIGKIMGLSVNTLKKHYHPELETGAIVANAQVANALFQKCLGNGPASVTACIFWLKSRAGWTDGSTDKVEHPEEQEEQGTIDVTAVSTEALLEIASAKVIDIETGEEVDARILA